MVPNFSAPFFSNLSPTYPDLVHERIQKNKKYDEELEITGISCPWMHVTARYNFQQAVVQIKELILIRALKQNLFER